MIRIKRVYAEPAVQDGYRVLVDRLWPRGVSKEQAALDLWLKEVAPTPELRNWFGHKPEQFAEFTARYESELAQNEATSRLRDVIRNQQQVTLLYAAHDPVVNHAQVLLAYLHRH